MLMAAMAIVAWVVFVAHINSAQPGDHLEQFVWAQQAAWGYPKHPPLPTWLVIATESVLGPSRYTAYLLGAACALATALLTAWIARRLIGPSLAGLVMLLWCLQQPFSRTAHLYNHNTVMMLAVAVCAVCAVQALDHRRYRWWFGTGLAAAAAVLSKYQALIPLAGIALAVALCTWRGLSTAVTGGAAAGERPASDGLAANPRALPRSLAIGMAVAIIATIVPLLPHVVWMVQTDFSTLRYASQSGLREAAGHAALPGLGERLSDALGLIAQQLRLLMPALVLWLVWWAVSRLRRGADSRGAAPMGVAERLAQDPAGRRFRRAWLIGLVAVPIAATLFTGILLGLRPQNHWSNQALQFVSLWLAWTLRPRDAVESLAGGRMENGAENRAQNRVDTAAQTNAQSSAQTSQSRPVLGAVVASLLLFSLHGLGMAEKGREAWWPPTADDRPSRRLDGQYPADRLAAAVVSDWQAVTGCPLRHLIGPSFEAGLVAVYRSDVTAAPRRAVAPERGVVRSERWLRPRVWTVDEWRRRPEALRRSVDDEGAVFIGPDDQGLPPIGDRRGSMAVAAAMRGSPERLTWVIQAPGRACERQVN